MAFERANTNGLQEQFNRLATNWPIDEARAAKLLREYKRVWDEVGEARFKAAVGKVIQESSYHYFPSVGEFRAFVPQNAQIVHCGEAGCLDGFRMVPDYEARRMYGNDTALAARKCGCARLV